MNSRDGTFCSIPPFSGASSAGHCCKTDTIAAFEPSGCAASGLVEPPKKVYKRAFSRTGTTLLRSLDTRSMPTPGGADFDRRLLK
jgi:hypothetical protein